MISIWKSRNGKIAILVAILLLIMIFVSPFLSIEGTEPFESPNEDITITTSLPPPGIYDNVMTKLPTLLDINAGEVYQLDVPNYNWYRGCSPTAVGMIMGYYDKVYDTNLLSGVMDPDIQVYANPYIASDSHYDDYCRPIDSSDPGSVHYSPDPKPDKSETGGGLPDNCIADFLDTSKSVFDLYYGWTQTIKIKNGMASYIDFRGYTSTCRRLESSQISYSLLKNEIEMGRPVLLSVDLDGNGYSDHTVTCFAWNEAYATPYVGVRDTWGGTVWIAVQPEGNLWGIKYAYLVEIEGISDYVPCYACAIGGGGMLTEYFQNSCPMGWSSTPVDCSVLCYRCEGKNLITQRYQDGICPNGWIYDIPQCSVEGDILCWSCIDGEATSMSFETSCPEGWHPYPITCPQKIPGFEIVTLITAISISLILLRKKW